MKRALETLHYSKIKGKQLLINEICRERICGPSDQKIFESPYIESDESYIARMSELANFLLGLNYSTVAVICHGCVIASLTGNYLGNARIIKANLQTIKNIANDVSLPTLCCGYNW